MAEAREPDLSVSALEYDHDGPRAVVSLAGRAGITDCGWLRPLLELQAAQEHGRLVVDLSRVSSMDWWVALILAWASRVVSRRGGVLVLASPQPAVARLLDAVAASGPFPVADGHRETGDKAVISGRGPLSPRWSRRSGYAGRSDPSAPSSGEIFASR